MRRILLAALLVLGGLLPALAALPELGPNEQWVVLATRPDRTDAVDFARLYGRDLTGVRVVKAENGRFVVIAGPMAVKTIAEARAKVADLTSLPDDAYLGTAKGLGEEVFAAAPPATRAFGRLEGNDAVSVTDGPITVTMASSPDKDDMRIPTFVARAGGKVLFDLNIADASASTPRSTVSFAQLDPTTKAPQIVMTSFSGGPHCCTLTRIATLMADGTWKILDAGTIDGTGYALEDIDGDGYVELIDQDDNFLYTFSSYAGSVAPTKIHRVANGQFTDVTRLPAMRPMVQRSLREMEADAKQYPQRWRENGFLAGWVATKVLLGETEEAWKRMLTRYDRSATVEGTTCVVGGKLAPCPKARRDKLPFPEALTVMLVEQGYLPSPAAVPAAGDTPKTR